MSSLSYHLCWDNQSERLSTVLSMEPGKDFRLLVLCYEVHLDSTENINKRSPCAPSSYYVYQNEILYSERVNGLLSKVFFTFVLCIQCEAENLSTLQL